MNKSPYVGPFLRIIASVYDFFLLLGVWFLVGSLALWLNGGEILHPLLALMGMPLFLIYADSKKLAVNDILSKTRLKKV